MFLHRIILRQDALRTEAFWQQIRDIYAVHQLVWSWFAKRPDGSRKFIYRQENEEHLPLVYVMSDDAPQVDDEVWHVERKYFAPKLRDDEHLEFVLRVNPTRRKSKGPGAGKRHDVVMQRKTELRAKGETAATDAELIHSACSEWFLAKGTPNGFLVDSERIWATGYRTQRIERKGAPPIRFATVELSGLLRVTDPALFVEMLGRGLGPAKGFGCGMMMVRRA